MSWYILVVGIFWLDGTLESYSTEIPAGQPCGYDQAIALALEEAKGAEFNRDWVLWRCDAVPNPPAAPLVPSEKG